MVIKMEVIKVSTLIIKIIMRKTITKTIIILLRLKKNNNNNNNNNNNINNNNSNNNNNNNNNNTNNKKSFRYTSSIREACHCRCGCGWLQDLIVLRTHNRLIQPKNGPNKWT